MSGVARTVGAIGLGLALATIPFVRYRYASPHHGAHTDHAPRHGGVLGMVGDVHLEVVRRAGHIEVYPSDAYRRPLTARGGAVRLDTGVTLPLEPAGDGLLATRFRHDADPREVRCTVVLESGRVVELDVEF
jgi:hypothetical protein